MEEKTLEIIPVLKEDRLDVSYGSTVIISDSEVTDKSDRSHLPYPKAVIFVLFSKFFEAFAANGVRTILVMYLHDSLGFSEDSATTYFHIFNFFGQFCPILGAVLADNYLGNVKTIFYFCIVYAFGWVGIVILTLPFSHPSAFAAMVPLVIFSLILIGIGNGSIRACVTSLGGSQFELPSQSKSLDRYFSHYYFVYTFGIFLSKIVPPQIRETVHSSSEHEYSYTAAFGVLAAAFVAAWVIFLSGMFMYKSENNVQTKSNILFKVIACTFAGLKYKLRNLRNHAWYDGSMLFYSANFVQDVSVVWKVLKLFIPLPMYWALYTQIDSNWTFQATQLNRMVFGYNIEADQAKAAAPLLLLFLIPFWEKLIMPTLRTHKIQISTLQSIAMGGFSAAFSFFCAAILQFCIECRAATNSEQLSIFWQLPQFILLMLGEVWLSIPGLNLSFTQSPPTMRSVMTAAWFCNNAFGNLIVIAITEWHPFKFDSNEYLLYGYLMFIAILIFCLLARNYRYTNYDERINGDVRSLQRRNSTDSF